MHQDGFNQTAMRQNAHLCEHTCKHSQILAFIRSLRDSYILVEVVHYMFPLESLYIVAITNLGP